MFQGKTIGVGICGGIAAYKVCDLIRRLKEAEADVHVMMTKAAQKFVTPLTFQALSGNPVHTDLFNLTEENEMGHISLADKADLICIAPATADILAKAAHGICDDLITTVLCATKAPVLFVPSMNVNMWENRITQRNVSQLKEVGHTVLEPDSGSLACGWIGKGRLSETETVVQEIVHLLSHSEKVYHFERK